MHRNYRNNLDFIASAFGACLANARDLVAEAKLLSKHQHKARSLSLSVLALEELGKMFCVDGLLFARVDDAKAKTYAKSLKSHTTKLSTLTLLPILFAQIASVDPRSTTEAAFAKSIAISIQDLKDRGNAVFALLKGEDFSSLDHWKQVGFYAQPHRNAFITPNETVSTQLADAVHMFAWRAVTILEFLLKDGNLERYIDQAKNIRTRMTEEEHAKLHASAEEFVLLLFPDDEEGSDT